MTGSVVLVGVGLALLVVAADRLVVSAVRLARSIGISTILIGAIIVGLGTSVPELLVSALAARGDELDVAMANVVGSNVANVTLVLGSAALLAPVLASNRTLRREGLLMFAAVSALALVLVDESVSSTEGFALLAALVIALGLLIVWSIGAGEIDVSVDGFVPTWQSITREVVIGVGALVVTVFGADILLDAALDIGRRLSWTDTFLGLLLGVGTSLPEMATAAAAARRREFDLVVGNVVGSNIFNSLAVAGTAAVLGPALLEDLSFVAVAAMLLTALLAGVLSRTGQRISRFEGLTLLAVFGGFALLVF